MIADEQTHRLPETDADRRKAIAALAGYARLRTLRRGGRQDAASGQRPYGELFAGEEPLSSRFGSLVFTGVEDDPETLATLERMGFSDAAQVAGDDPRAGTTAASPRPRTERGRELFTRLAPRLLDAAHGDRRAGHRLHPLRRLLLAPVRRACSCSRCSWPSPSCSS